MSIQFKIIPIFYAFIIINCASTYNTTYNISQKKYDYIIRGSQTFGKLDFESSLPIEYTAFQMGGNIYSRKGTGIYMYGVALRKMGIKNEEDAIKIYNESHSDKLNEKQIAILMTGFNSKK
jgi:hypothetical protein